MFESILQGELMNPLILSIMLGAASSFAAPTTSEACMFGVVRTVSAADQATDELNAGHNARAIARLYDQFGPSINSWALNPTTSTAAQREVVLIVALSTLRTEGRLRRDRCAGPVRDRDVVRGNLDWAIRAMEGLAFVGDTTERHLAEAWARDPALHDAARIKLEKLAEDGKLLSPFQFDALARLYREDRKPQRAQWAATQAEKRLD
jgi:hypothetical protein